jgi:rfaE bifunctional protein kinase chain/domain
MKRGGTMKNNFYERISRIDTDLSIYIDRFSQSTVLLIGDLVLDEYVTGEVERHSREAPVLILKHGKTVQIPGGGANTAMNLAFLGAKVKVVGLVGDDAQGASLLTMLSCCGVDISGVFRVGSKKTVTKTRILGRSRQAVSQQIVRIDRKGDYMLTEDLERDIVKYIELEISNVDLVLCSDYSDGLLSSDVIASALKHGKCVVDAQVGLQRYKNALMFTPNLAEAETSVGFEITSEEKLQLAGERLLELTGAECIVITRGGDGMSVFRENIPRADIPSFNTSDIRDVTGAGDTAVATMGLALCGGADFWESAVLGNLAASLVIRHEGAATTTPSEMRLELEKLISRQAMFAS